MLCPFFRQRLYSSLASPLSSSSSPSSSPVSSLTTTNGKKDANILMNEKRKKLRLNMAERILNIRRVDSIAKINHTAEERIKKQISTKSAHKILPLSSTDTAADKVRKLAREIILDQRARAAASLVDKHGIPILTPVNGIGHFVLSLQRIVFTYCSHARDSDGIKEFLSKNLHILAERDPGIEFVVEPRWGKLPLIRGFFLNGHSKVLCVKSMTSEEVMERYLLLRNSSGKQLEKFHQKVKSTAPAVRPIWSPFHMNNFGKNDPIEPYRTNN